MSKRIAETISVTQLFRMFPDEDACYQWLERARWNGQPVCPHCGGVENIGESPSKPHTYWHRDCRKHFTVTTKTCMHATKRPLQDWIYAIYSVLTARKGVSAMQLSKELGCQYRTAWYMLHRIREQRPHQKPKPSRRRHRRPTTSSNPRPFSVPISKSSTTETSSWARWSG